MTVTFGASALEIADDAGLPLASWPYAALHTVERVRAGQAVRLACGERDGARLVLGDEDRGEEVRAALLARAPQLGSRSRLSWRTCRRFGTAMVGIAATAAALWFLWPPIADLAAGLVPRSWEDRLGRQLVEELQATDRRCDQPAGKAALDRLVARLTERLDSPHPVSVTVVDRAEANAFAAPGGHILLLRGLIDSAHSADEVAGVLAHEIGHVVERHGVRSMVRNLGVGLIFEVMSGGSGLGQVAPTLTMLAYSRAFETEADARAVELLTAAGIRTDGLAAFFARSAQEEAEMPQVLAYFSTHPLAAQRQIAAAGEARGGGAAMPAADWAALQGICGSTG